MTYILRFKLKGVKDKVYYEGYLKSRREPSYISEREYQSAQKDPHEFKSISRALHILRELEKYDKRIMSGEIVKLY